jgi:hypothetical protein
MKGTLHIHVPSRTYGTCRHGARYRDVTSGADGRSWHQLLELCSLSDVLLADPDGVYDPRVYNDRLLIGL